MIGQLVNQLVTALKDDSVGFQVHVDAVASAESVTLPSVPDNHIYGLDTPVDLARTNLPALSVAPARTRTPEVKSQGKRDSVHTASFSYATQEVDADEWRAEVMWMAEALMRFLDGFNSCNAAYVGDSGVLLVRNVVVEYSVTWQEPPNSVRGFVLNADFLVRDTY